MSGFRRCGMAGAGSAAVAYLVLVLPVGLAFGALERRVAIIR